MTDIDKAAQAIQNQPITWNCHAGVQHELGCPHQDWTKEQLREAVEAQKKNVAWGGSQMLERLEQARREERESTLSELFESEHPGWGPEDAGIKAAKTLKELRNRTKEA